MLTFWTFNHITLNGGGASRACEGSAIGEVELKPTFRTLNYSFPHELSLHPKTVHAKIKIFSSLLNI